MRHGERERNGRNAHVAADAFVRLRREASPRTIASGATRSLFRSRCRCARFGLFGDDQILDLVVSGLRDDLFLHQFVLGAVGTTVDDLLRIGVADPRQGFQLIFRCRIEVELVGRVGFAICPFGAMASGFEPGSPFAFCWATPKLLTSESAKTRTAI